MFTILIILCITYLTLVTANCIVSDQVVFFTGVYPELGTEDNRVPIWLNISFTANNCNDPFDFISFAVPFEIQLWTADNNPRNISSLFIHTGDVLGEKFDEESFGNNNKEDFYSPTLKSQLDLIHNPYNCTTVDLRETGKSLGTIPPRNKDDYYITSGLTSRNDLANKDITYYSAACRINPFFYQPNVKVGLKNMGFYQDMITILRGLDYGNNNINNTFGFVDSLEVDNIKNIRYLTFPHVNYPIYTDITYHVPIIPRTIGTIPPLQPLPNDYRILIHNYAFIQQFVNLKYSSKTVVASSLFLNIETGFAPTHVAFSVIVDVPIIVTPGWQPLLQFTAPFSLNYCNITTTFVNIQRNHIAHYDTITSTTHGYDTQYITLQNTTQIAHHVIEHSNYIPFPSTDAGSTVHFSCSGEYYSPTDPTLLTSALQAEQHYDMFASIVIRLAQHMTAMPPPQPVVNVKSALQIVNNDLENIDGLYYDPFASDWDDINDLGSYIGIPQSTNNNNPDNENNTMDTNDQTNNPIIYNIIHQSFAPTFLGTTTLPITPSFDTELGLSTNCTAVKGDMCFLQFSIDFMENAVFANRSAIFPAQHDTILDVVGLTGHSMQIHTNVMNTGTRNTFGNKSKQQQQQYGSAYTNWPLQNFITPHNGQYGGQNAGLLDGMMLQLRENKIGNNYALQLGHLGIRRLDYCFVDEFGHSPYRNAFHHYAVMPFYSTFDSLQNATTTMTNTPSGNINIDGQSTGITKQLLPTNASGDPHDSDSDMRVEQKRFPGQTLPRSPWFRTNWVSGDNTGLRLGALQFLGLFRQGGTRANTIKTGKSIDDINNLGSLQHRADLHHNICTPNGIGVIECYNQYGLIDFLGDNNNNNNNITANNEQDFNLLNSMNILTNSWYKTDNTPQLDTTIYHLNLDDGVPDVARKVFKCRVEMETFFPLFFYLPPIMNNTKNNDNDDNRENISNISFFGKSKINPQYIYTTRYNTPQQQQEGQHQYRSIHYNTRYAQQKQQQLHYANEKQFQTNNTTTTDNTQILTSTTQTIQSNINPYYGTIATPHSSLFQHYRTVTTSTASTTSTNNTNINNNLVYYNFLPNTPEIIYNNITNQFTASWGYSPYMNQYTTQPAYLNRFATAGSSGPNGVIQHTHQPGIFGTTPRLGMSSLPPLIYNTTFGFEIVINLPLFSNNNSTIDNNNTSIVHQLIKTRFFSTIQSILFETIIKTTHQLLMPYHLIYPMLPWSVQYDDIKGQIIIIVMTPLEHNLAQWLFKDLNTELTTLSPPDDDSNSTNAQRKSFNNITFKNNINFETQEVKQQQEITESGTTTTPNHILKQSPLIFHPVHGFNTIERTESFFSSLNNNQNKQNQKLNLNNLIDILQSKLDTLLTPSESTNLDIQQNRVHRQPAYLKSKKFKFSLNNNNNNNHNNDIQSINTFDPAIQIAPLVQHMEHFSTQSNAAACVYDPEGSYYEGADKDCFYKRVQYKPYRGSDRLLARRGIEGGKLKWSKGTMHGVAQATTTVQQDVQQLQQQHQGSDDSNIDNTGQIAYIGVLLNRLDKEMKKQQKHKNEHNNNSHFDSISIDAYITATQQLNTQLYEYISASPLESTILEENNTEINKLIEDLIFLYKKQHSLQQLFSLYNNIDNENTENNNNNNNNNSHYTTQSQESQHQTSFTDIQSIITQRLSTIVNTHWEKHNVYVHEILERKLKYQDEVEDEDLMYNDDVSNNSAGYHEVVIENNINNLDVDYTTYIKSVDTMFDEYKTNLINNIQSKKSSSSPQQQKQNKMNNALLAANSNSNTNNTNTTTTNVPYITITRFLSQRSLTLYSHNNLQDQDETSIDCGGNSAPLCPSSDYNVLFQPIQTIKQQDYKQYPEILFGNYNLQIASSTTTTTNSVNNISPSRRQEIISNIMYQCLRDADCISGYCLPLHPHAEQFQIVAESNKNKNNKNTKQSQKNKSSRVIIQSHVGDSLDYQMLYESSNLYSNYQNINNTTDTSPDNTYIPKINNVQGSILYRGNKKGQRGAGELRYVPRQDAVSVHSPGTSLENNSKYIPTNPKTTPHLDNGKSQPPPKEDGVMSRIFKSFVDKKKSIKYAPQYRLASNIPAYGMCVHESYRSIGNIED